MRACAGRDLAADLEFFAGRGYEQHRRELRALREAVAGKDIRVGKVVRVADGYVSEPGGKVVDLRDEPLRYNTKDSLLNPDFLALGDPAVDWLARLELPR